MTEIQIGDGKIGPGYPCLIVAEVSANHHQKFEEAVEIIKAAHQAGADAVKLQTYTPDTITINSDKEWFLVQGKDLPEDWKRKTLYELYQTAYTPWDWQPKLKKVAGELGLILFSTPFEETAVDFLEAMNVPCFKVASYEVTHIPLLKKIARTKKPVIMSIGFATLPEIELAVKTLRDNGTRELAILHCVTAYAESPRPEDMNLATIRDIQERFGVVAGFSDNNAGIEIPVLAAAVGASIIEKHFILSRSSGGPDSRFSIEPEELKQMVKEIRDFEKTGGISYEEERVRQALGRVHYGPVNQIEVNCRNYRQSVFVVSDLKKGEEFTRDNIRVVRPAFGLEPRFWDEVMGRNAARNIKRGTPLSWELVV